MLIYSGGSVPSVILHSNKNSIAELLGEVKLKKCVIPMTWEDIPSGLTSWLQNPHFFLSKMVYKELKRDSFEGRI